MRKLVTVPRLTELVQCAKMVADQQQLGLVPAQIMVVLTHGFANDLLSASNSVKVLFKLECIGQSLSIGYTYAMARNATVKNIAWDDF
jgi:hypothetical protein